MLHLNELTPSDSGGHLLSTTFGFVALSHSQNTLAELRLYLQSSLSVHACRAQLWRASIPEQAPLAKDVDWEALGKNYELAGGSIKQAVVRAATQAALRIEVTMTCLGTDLVQSQAAYAINKFCFSCSCKHVALRRGLHWSSEFQSFCYCLSSSFCWNAGWCSYD